MRISDWSSDVCSSDLLNLKTPTSPTYTPEAVLPKEAQELGFGTYSTGAVRILGVNSVNKADAGTFVLDLAPYIEDSVDLNRWSADVGSINVSAGELQITGPAYDPTDADGAYIRSEEHTSELQSLLRISNAVFCLKKKNNN